MTGLASGMSPMVGLLLPRVSDGGFLTSEEINAGIVRAGLN